MHTSNVERPDVGRLEPVLVTAQELASMLRVSKRTLWRKRSAGHLPNSLRIGGVVRWRLDEILEWIDEGCPRPLKPQNT